MSTATSGTGSSLSGIFAKFVAKFLVNWIKKTLGIGKGSQQPALSSTPSQVEGRPERDRSRETYGSHTGSDGGRAFEDPGRATAIQGDDYGAHRGVGTPSYMGPAGERAYTALPPEASAARVWDDNVDRERRDVLRNADAGALRRFGMGDAQVEQCARGRVPQGYLLERIIAESNALWQLISNSPEAQLATNGFHSQIVDIRIGETRILGFPFGGQPVVLVLGAASVGTA